MPHDTHLFHMPANDPENPWTEAPPDGTPVKTMCGLDDEFHQVSATPMTRNKPYCSVCLSMVFSAIGYEYGQMVETVNALADSLRLLTETVQALNHRVTLLREAMELPAEEVTDGDATAQV